MGIRNPASIAADPQLVRAVSQVLGHRHLGQWSSDHSKEADSFSGWNYVAIQWCGRQAARAHGYVYADSSAPKMSLRKSHRKVYGPMWKAIVKDGSADLADESNRIARLVERPNPQCSGSMFQWEFIQQLRLHGVCLVFNRPSKKAMMAAAGGMLIKHTAARYIIPVAMTEPVYPGQYRDVPNGGVKIMPYETGISWFVNPFVHQLSGNVIPIEWMSMIRYPHPVLRSDGMSPTDASGWWIDSATMVDMARWRQLRRGPKPYGIVSVDGEEITDPMLDRIERRINDKLRDGHSDDNVVALGAKVSLNTNTTPVDMDYTGAFDQMQGAILAAQGVSKSAVGLNDSMTYGAVAAANQMTLTGVQSDLDLLAGDWTDMAEDEGEPVAVEYEVQPIDDPELIEGQLGLDLQAGMRTGREWRAIRGLPPFGDWRDDARVTGMGFVVDPDKPPEPQQGPPAGMPPGAGMPGMPPGPPPAAPKPGAFEDVKKAPFDNLVAKAVVPSVSVDMEEVIVAGGEKQIGVIRSLMKAGCKVHVFTSQPAGAAKRMMKSIGLDIPVNESIDADAYYDDPDMGLEDIAEMLPVSEAKAKLMRKEPKKERLGCVMLSAPESVAEYCRTIQAGIDQDNLQGDGLEDFLHVTLLYGLVGCTIEEVVTAVRKLNQCSAVFGPVGTFDNEQYTVLKIGMESEQLQKNHKILKGVFPVEETHPEYIPHMTLAYCTPEEAAKHKGDCVLTGRSVRFTEAVVSMGGRKVKVPLRYEEPEAIQPIVKSASRLKFVDPNAELMETLVKAVADLGQQVRAIAKPNVASVVGLGSPSHVDANVKAAGLCLLAKDTGRVLMLQRALSDDDPASGKWEFPGGHLEDGEDSLTAAKREWEEEVGKRVPEFTVKGQWRAGIYVGYVGEIENEADVPINTGGKRVLNPDDPDGDAIETVAWWSPSELDGNQSMRAELIDSMPEVLRAIRSMPVNRLNGKAYGSAGKPNGNGKHLDGDFLARGLIEEFGYPEDFEDYKQRVKRVVERVASVLKIDPLECLKNAIDPMVFVPWRDSVMGVKA